MSEAANTIQADGVRMLQAGDILGATAAFQQAVDENPDDGRSRAFLGVCHARRGDSIAAIAELEQAVRLLPDDAATRYNLALAFYQARRTDEARSELNQTLTLNPEHTGARDLLSRMEQSEAAGAGTVTSAPGSAPEGQSSGGAGAASEPEAFGSGPGAEPLSWGPAPQAAPSAPAPAPSGMAYTPTAAEAFQEAPGLGIRILRGVGWGALHAQWWTLLMVFWDSIYGRIPLGSGTAVAAAGYGVFFALCGAVVGFIIALVDGDDEMGAKVGVGAGLLLLGVEYLQYRSPLILVNIFFWFFTGRFIGAAIGSRVQRPIIR